MPERLQKIIASCGVCSRRAAEELITQGRVRCNGRTAELGDRADLSVDEIEIDGRPLSAPEAPVTLLLYKPRGYVTTVKDDRGRKTVMELVPQQARLFPVGRLDLNSEGLLLMTNDGALAHRLTHPRHEISKIYEVWVSGWQASALPLLSRPVVLDGVRIRPPAVHLLHTENGTAKLEITIHEGRNRQIRRMCELAGVRVTRLKRVAEGPLRLDGLKPGEYRALTESELQSLSEL